MLRTFIVLVVVVLLAPSALAQQPQPADPAFLTKAITVLQDQRNQALDGAAAAMARAITLEDENKKLKAELDAAKKPPEGK